MRLNLYPPEHITSDKIEQAIHILEVRLIAQPDGSILGVPITPERHGNQGRLRMPRHKRQINGRLPGPEAA